MGSLHTERKCTTTFKYAHSFSPSHKASPKQSKTEAEWKSNIPVESPTSTVRRIKRESSRTKGKKKEKKKRKKNWKTQIGSESFDLDLKQLEMNRLGEIIGKVGRKDGGKVESLGRVFFCSSRFVR